MKIKNRHNLSVISVYHYVTDAKEVMMNDFKCIEEMMKLNSRLANFEYQNAYTDLLKVFYFLDRKDKTCHCKIIDALYNSKGRELTYLQISINLNVSDNSLRRYRKQYTEWFGYFLELQRKNMSLIS